MSKKTAEVIVQPEPAAPASLSDRLAQELAGYTTEQLRAELARGLQVTAECLLRLALVVKLLEERGEDLSGLRLPLLHHLRRIACGQVLPEVVVRFAAAPGLIAKIGSLPLPEQKRLAEGGKVTVVVRTAAGETTHKQVDPLHLAPGQVSLVFARDHLRGIAEQGVLLDQRPERGEKQPPRGRVRSDSARGGLRVGRVFVPQSEVIEALGHLRDEISQDGDGGEDGTTRNLPIPLTTQEHRRLKIASANATAHEGKDVSMAELIRRAMRMAGLI